MSSGKDLIDNLIQSKAVFVVAMSDCARSKKIKEVFSSYEINQDKFEVLDIDGRDDTSVLQFYLGQKTGASSVLSAQCSVPSERAVPRVFIGGKDVGGWDEVDAAHRYSVLW